MSMAAILLAMTPLASAGATGVEATKSPPRRAIAVSVTASARILKPAIVTLANLDSIAQEDKGQARIQRRVEKSGDHYGENAPATIWIEFS